MMAPAAPVGPLPLGDVGTWQTPLDVVELAARVQHCQTAPIAMKGPALESLLTWLLPTIPGFSVRHVNRWTTGGASEVDLSVFNFQHAAGFASFPDSILVECKNRSKRMTSDDVAWFDWKMQLGGVELGIIVTAIGITGNVARKTAAWSIVGKANMAAPKRRILVVTLEEIAGLGSKDALRELLITKASLLPLWAPQI